MAHSRRNASGIDPGIRHVICIGLMGAERSPVGARVAAMLGWRLVDVDEEVEVRTGKTVAELSYEGGEEAYRPQELDVVLHRLADEERSVLLAGGIALDPAARQAIGAVDVVAVYLRADPDALATLAQLELEHEHAAATGDRLAALRGMFRDRDATYRALADIEVQVDAHTAEDAARLVIGALSGEAASPPRAAP